MSKLFCGNSDCGAYLGSMGADSCVHCGWIDPDAIEAAATEQLLQRIADLERQLEEALNDAKRWRTFLSTRPKATHDVINQAIDDAAMQKGQS